jgi:formylglycine-generating enzyme
MRKKIFLLMILSLSILSSCATDSNINTKNGINYIETGIDTNAWARIPAGEFLSGMHNHEIDVDYDYEIMISDVTNGQFANYLNEALSKGTIKIKDNKVLGYYPGDEFHSYNHEFEIKAGDCLHVKIDEPGLHIQFDDQFFSAEKGYENHPVVMVTWFGAKAYADFYGWRLPTEIEWEKAARGTDGRVFPWGDEILRNQVNFHSSRNVLQKLFSEHTTTTPVGYYNGKKYGDYQTENAQSPYGLYDMAGNVWQWTGNVYPKTHLRYMRGGSQANYEYNLRTWARNSAGPDFYGINIGFRCARDVQKKEVTEQKNN